MASVRDILKVHVQKKALKNSTSINVRSNQIISSRGETPVSPVQREKGKKTSARNIFSHQTTSLPIASDYLVPLLGEISTETDLKKRVLKNKTSINGQSNQLISSSKTSVSSVELEKTKTSSALNMFSHQTSSLPITSSCLIPLLGEISTQTDVLKIQISNVQGTPPSKKAINDDLVQKGETSSTFNVVSHQTTSSPFTSAYPVPSRRDIYCEDDVLNIKISNVQGTASNKNTLKAFSHDLTSNQSHVIHRDRSNQNVKSGYVNEIQEKISLPEQFRDGQLIIQKETYPTEVRSPINQSSVLNKNPLTKTSDQERTDLSRYHPSHKTDILQTTILTYPMGNQYPLPFYQMGASEMMSAYPFDTHNGSPERSPCYHTGAIMTPPPPDIMNSHKTVPLHHIGTVQETTKSQMGDLAKKTEIYQPEISSSVGSSGSHDQQQRQNFQNQFNGITTNPHNSASTCQCCCHAQSQSQSSHPSAFGLENRRPSVIMVPTSWSNTSSSESHVPLKADAPYIHQSETQMDETDEDEIEEKFFRANIDGKTARFKLRREDWEKIQIKKFPSGGRLLSGDWIKIFHNKVKESNPWCSLRFHNNHVRAEHSRKMHSAAFFRGSAECKRPECGVKVRFVILKEKGKYVDVTYVGNVCHSSQPSVIDVNNVKKKNKKTRRNFSS